MEITRDRHYKKFLEHCKKYIDEYFENTLDEIKSVSESPLENYFALGWELIKFANHLGLKDYELLPQVKIDEIGKLVWGSKVRYKYRLDFIIIKQTDYDRLPKGLPPENKIAVEIDGFQFHEKTRDQLIYEKRRERFLLSNRWKVFHFIGSEINNSPFRCLEEIKEFLLS